MKKVAAILVFGFMVRILVSCCGGIIGGNNCCDDCAAPTEIQYTIHSINSSHLNGTEPSAVVVGAGISVSKGTYGMSITYAIEQLAYHKSGRYSMFNAAYALDCVCDPFEFVARDKISEIRIIALKDFDADHSASSEVTQFFKVWSNDQYRSVPDFIENGHNLWYRDTLPLSESFAVFLKHPTVNTGEHQFRIEMLLSDGTLLQYETTVINLE